MNSGTPAVKRPGRPLSFDRDQALHAAMLQFWRTGYETTSVSDLTSAMGITTPSLYAAFGDKEGLFLECLRHYTVPDGVPASEMIRKAPSARHAARHLLEVSAHWFTQPGNPAGCLVASAASSGSTSAGPVRTALKNVRQDVEVALRKRVQQDIRSGHLPPTANARALAAMTVALIQGMSTLARDGASRKHLLSIIEPVMTAWPGKDQVQPAS